jgi:hypothetical protein
MQSPIINRPRAWGNFAKPPAASADELIALVITTWYEGKILSLRPKVKVVRKC